MTTFAGFAEFWMVTYDCTCILSNIDHPSNTNRAENKAQNGESLEGIQGICFNFVAV